MMNARHGTLLVLLFLAAMPLFAQQNTTPTLQLQTRIVVLDVVVTDKKGNLVNTLGKDDFTIVDDKVPQAIRSFEPPSAHVQPKATVVTSTADLKKIGDAPVTILVLDELNTQFADMSFARQSLTKYLQAQPAVLTQPTELLIATNTRFELMHDYTQSRDELLDKVKHQPAEFPYKATAGKGGPQAVERIAQSLASLESLAQASAGTPGRKNVIWVGAGFPSVDPNVMDQKTAATVLHAVRVCTDMLLSARVTLYTIDPTANTTSTVYAETPEDLAAAETENGGDPSAGGVTFSNFAPETGGRAFSSRNDVNNEIAEGIAAGTLYYTLAYRPTAASGALTEPDAYHAVRIVLKDPNLRATTRDGYYPPSAVELKPDAGASAPDQKQATAQLRLDLSNAVTSALPYNALEVSAVRGADGYVVTVKGAGLTWRDASAQQQTAEATVLAAWYDAKGKLLGHNAKELTAARAVRGAEAPTGDGVFVLPVALPGGVSRLRLVVRDAASARMGTVDLKP